MKSQDEIDQEYLNALNQMMKEGQEKFGEGFIPEIKYQRDRHEIYTHPEYRYFCRHCGLKGYNATALQFNDVKCVYPNDYDLNMFKPK